MIIAHDDARLSWPGAVSLERTAGYTRPWRIPFSEKLLFFPVLAAAAAKPSGVRLAFRSTTAGLAGTIAPHAENTHMDLFVDGAFAATLEMADRAEFRFDGLGGGEKLLELWLPHKGNFALEQLILDDGASLRPHDDPRPKWVTYGSSITHCARASTPSRTWPAIVAQARGLNLASLGYGGQCHLDALLARTMRDMPADYLSICAGINIYGGATLNARTFGSSLLGFVRIVREKHPEAPLLLISPIYGVHREETPNAQGWTLANYREEVEAAARTLREFGDRNVHYLDGLRLFDSSLAHLLPDQLHPDAVGIEEMGKNFLAHGAPLLFGD